MSKALAFATVKPPLPFVSRTPKMPAGLQISTVVEQEALANAEEAIRAVLEYRRDQGMTIPADAYPEIRRVTVAA